MAMTWQSHGNDMTTTCHRRGHGMATKWQIHGSSTATTWQTTWQHARAWQHAWQHTWQHAWQHASLVASSDRSLRTAVIMEGRRTAAWPIATQATSSVALPSSFRCCSNCARTSWKCLGSMLANSCSNKADWFTTMSSHASRSNMLPTHDA